MRKFITLTILIMTGIVVMNGFPQNVSSIEATNAARNWVQVITDKFGSWGGSIVATVEPPEMFTRDGKVIGYLFRVKPQGVIIVSIRKELSPVKAFLPTGNIAQTQYGEGFDLIKGLMGRIVDQVESRYGEIQSIPPGKISEITNQDCNQQWDFILNYEPGMLTPEVPDVTTDGNYQQGDTLIHTRWRQSPPFNNDCPYLECENTSNGNAIAGCAAVSGAMILKYWDWPPYGVSEPYNDYYDWIHMKDDVYTNSPPIVQNAVANLVHEFGLAVETEYGCDASSMNSYDLQMYSFEDYFRFEPDVWQAWRSDYSAESWYNLIKTQLNQNRPINYHVTAHWIDADGWLEVPPDIKFYHFNYGWANANTTWYLLDELELGDEDEENMFVDISPENCIGSLMNGNYTTVPGWFNYRYFDVNTSGAGASFSPGQYLQMLPGIKVKGIGTNSYVKFEGTAPDNNTYMYNSGDKSKGIIIRNGAVRLKNNGTLKIK